MKKITTFTCFLLIALSTLKGQTSIKDVDKLYRKYKITDSIIVTNAKVSVKFQVLKNLDESEKPLAITLIGFTGSQSKYDVESIIDKLASDKKKTGYKYSGTSQINFPLGDFTEIVTVLVYTKGSQYAKYGIGDNIPQIPNPNPSYETAADQTKNFKIFQKNFERDAKGYFIYLEVGDISRMSNNKGQDFDF